MIKVCRSCLAATLAALMLTVPVVADNDQDIRAAGNDVTITEIQLNLKPGAALPKYIGSELKAPSDIFENNSVKFKTATGDDNAKGVLTNIEYKYVTSNQKEYPDTRFWPIKKTNNGYGLDKNKKLSLKFTFSVGENGGKKFKLDTAKDLPITIRDRQFTIPANDLKVGPDGRYTAYLPLKAYRKVKFIPDKGYKKLCLKNGIPNLDNQLEYDVDLEDGQDVQYFSLQGTKFDVEYNDPSRPIGLQVEVKNKGRSFVNLNDTFAYQNLDELNKADAINQLVIHIMTRKDENDPQLPPILNGKDVTIKEGAKFDKLSLVELFKEVVGQKAEGDKSKIVFTLPAGFNPDNPTHGTYKVTMSFKNEANGLEASWVSTVTVDPKQKPPVPAPQPQPKPQEKTDSAYFDLGRYLLPTCPDSKCAKTETGAKKDDVPNTAAAVNN